MARLIQRTSILLLGITLLTSLSGCRTFLGEWLMEHEEGLSKIAHEC